MKKDLIRVAAKEKGEQYYVPEKPCMRGHSLRITSDGSCLECKRLNERNRYAQNPEKYRKKSSAYVANNREKILVKNKERWASLSDEKHEKINAYRKKYYQKTIEERRVEKRKYYSQVKNDPIRYAKLRATVKATRKHPGRPCAAMRRASKLERTPKWVTGDINWLIKETYLLAALRTKLHGFSWHVDHIIPLQGELVSGLHVPTNLQVIPWIDNIKKGNKYAEA